MSKLQFLKNNDLSISIISRKMIEMLQSYIFTHNIVQYWVNIVQYWHKKMFARSIVSMFLIFYKIARQLKKYFLNFPKMPHLFWSKS